MLKVFILSLKLRIIYVINNIIYSFKQIPLIGKEISSDCYSSKPLKVIGTIIAMLIEISWEFLTKKFLYFLVFLMGLPSAIQVFMFGETEDPQVMGFSITFIFLSVIGGLLNNEMFLTSKDKYYAIFTMRINAKKYVISNYIYYLIKTALAFIPFILLFGTDTNENISTRLLLILPLIMINIKVFFANIRINYFQRTKKASFEKGAKFIKNLIIVIAFICAYALPIVGFEMTSNILWIIYTISLILGIYSFFNICKFNNYRMMYKKLFAEENELKINFEDFKTNTKEASLNQINQDDIAFSSNKKGYAFFNELFANRHKSILEKTAKLQTVIILIIAITALFITQIPIFADFKGTINNALLVSFPFMVYIMFLLNNGTIITQAMFMNCDHSMLTYKFYRTPQAILGLFKERLKTLIRINIIPAITIGLALPILLFATGGTDNFANYIILFVSTIAMSIFFSTHYLVIYYLIQPYNVESEMKSAMYRIVVVATYIAFYSLMDLKLPTLLFGSLITLFAIIYIFISLILIYKFAPKTFKLRK